MKFSSREDVELPIERVFDAVTDFDMFDRRALRRGAEVSRTDPPTGKGEGTSWDVSLQFRGRERELQAQVTEYSQPESMAIKSQSGGLKIDLTVALVALNPQKTRVIIGLELTPSNLSARLLVQSLKLAKASLSKRFSTAITDYARSLEQENTPPRAAQA
ncbi:MAG: SRPBCC family protein [Pseudomonadota bacterium]